MTFRTGPEGWLGPAGLGWSTEQDRETPDQGAYEGTSRGDLRGPRTLSQLQAPSRCNATTVHWEGTAQAAQAGRAKTRGDPRASWCPSAPALCPRAPLVPRPAPCGGGEDRAGAQTGGIALWDRPSALPRIPMSWTWNEAQREHLGGRCGCGVGHQGDWSPGV